MQLARSLALIAVMCGTVAAQPNARKEAAEHFKRGEELQADTRYRDAIAEYEQAYVLVPHANVLFNIAVCWEKLNEHERAADNYQRYLDDFEGTAPDTEVVLAKVKDLRAKAAAVKPPVRFDEPPVVGKPPDGRGITDFVEPTPKPWRNWHAGVSYGVGFGDAPTERYLLHGGIRIKDRFDADAIVGAFGKNDRAVGVLARLVVTRTDYATPFARGGVTLGYAKQDASSTAKTRFPIGLEAGGGVQLGRKGKLEVAAVVRWVAGGWGEADTSADSFVNDSIAFAVDVGLVLDFGLISGAR